MTDDQIIQLVRLAGFGPAAEWPGIKEQFIDLVRQAITTHEQQTQNAKTPDPWG